MKRVCWIVLLAGIMVLSLSLTSGAQPPEDAALEPAWRQKARKELKAYPPAKEGMVRYVLYLEPKADESLFKVELIVGRVIETDGVNRYGIGGAMSQETVQGWGYPMLVVGQEGFDRVWSTKMGVPPGQPKVKAFVPIAGEPTLIRYNSKLPVVVYVPAGGEVRYRIWEAPPQAMDVLPG